MGCGPFLFIMFPRAFLQEGRLSAKLTLKGKALRAKLDLRRYAVAKDPGWVLNFPALTSPRIVTPTQQNRGAKTELLL